MCISACLHLSITLFFSWLFCLFHAPPFSLLSQYPSLFLFYLFFKFPIFLFFTYSPSSLLSLTVFSIPQTVVMASPGINIKALHNSATASIMYDAMSHFGTMCPSLSPILSLCLALSASLCLSQVKPGSTIYINDKCIAFKQWTEITLCVAMLAMLQLVFWKSQLHIKKAVQPLKSLEMRPSCSYDNIMTKLNVTESNKKHDDSLSCVSACWIIALHLCNQHCCKEDYCGCGRIHSKSNTEEDYLYLL